MEFYLQLFSNSKIPASNLNQSIKKLKIFMLPFLARNWVQPYLVVSLQRKKYATPFS